MGPVRIDAAAVDRDVIVRRIAVGIIAAVYVADNRRVLVDRHRIPLRSKPRAVKDEAAIKAAFCDDRAARNVYRIPGHCAIRRPAACQCAAGIEPICRSNRNAVPFDRPCIAFPADHFIDTPARYIGVIQTDRVPRDRTAAAAAAPDAARTAGVCACHGSGNRHMIVPDRALEDAPPACHGLQNSASADLYSIVDDVAVLAVAAGDFRCRGISRHMNDCRPVGLGDPRPRHAGEEHRRGDLRSAVSHAAPPFPKMVLSAVLCLYPTSPLRPAQMALAPFQNL